jgi:protein-S-isoprenylcysteine O-methyltransferase
LYRDRAGCPDHRLAGEAPALQTHGIDRRYIIASGGFAGDEMRGMPLSFKLGLVYLASELVLTITRRSRSKTGTKQDKSTLGMIWVVIAVSVAAGIFVSRSPSLRAGVIGLFDFPRSDWIPLLAVAFFAAGLTIRWWAIVTLGRFFTVDVVIEKDHEVVQRGPFRWARHPSYTGVLLAFVGWAMTLWNWVAIALVLVPIFIALVRRMNVEEEALSKALGEKYVSYMRRTKRLVPGVY